MELDEVRRALQSDDEEARHAALAGVPADGALEALQLLVEAMGDESWRVRKEAVSRVTAWPRPEEAAAGLIVALGEDSNIARRNAAVEALGLVGRPAVPLLLDALQVGVVSRKLVIDALGVIGDARAVGPLSAALRDADANLRAAAAEALGHLGRREAVPALQAALAAGDLLTRLAALEALNRLGASVPYHILAPLLGEPVLRRAALEALGFAGDAGALPDMIAALADRSRGAREAAVTALQALHAMVSSEVSALIEDHLHAAPAAALDGLCATLASDSRALRRSAAALLGWARRAETLPALCQLLRDEGTQDVAADAMVAFGERAAEPLQALCPELDPDLRALIFELLPRLGTAAAAPQLCELLARATADDEPEPAAAAARALGLIGQAVGLPRGPGPVAGLFQALGREGQVASAAAAALGAIGARAYDEVHTLVAAHGLGGPIGPYLCRVLGACGRAEDRRLLLGALRDESAVLRRAAADALSGLGGEPAVTEALVFALSDESISVRAAAARALGALGAAAAAPALAAVALGSSHEGGDRDDEPPVRAAALRALGLIGDPAALPALRALATNADGALASIALEMLGRLGTADDEPVLHAGLRHDDTEAVKAAARALGTRASATARAAVCEALGHPRWDVRRAAAEALASSTDAASRAALRARLEVEADELVRQAITQALAQRG
ncbi:MAG: HEAT repeat domain-containing protein [Deltaproteobacteria bacterium]|nr:HEAT repeat domain-containing protein [Deltaproteobacteria bacterium]